ncbi:MAG: tetratricopeptide repeat protein [Pseudonocardiaceae bacterium]
MTLVATAGNHTANPADEQLAQTCALPHAVHRTILIVDIAGFGDRRRTNLHQVAARKGIYGCLCEAFAKSGVCWDDCYYEDRGDGVLILIPPDIPKSLLVVQLPQEMAAALGEHNQACPREARIRLRVAVHAGEIQHDDHGVTGTAINLAFRLLETEALRMALAGSPGALALIASNWLYEEVIRHAPASHPTTYRRVRVAVKETEDTAWVCLPDHPYPPRDDTNDLPTPRATKNAMAVPRQLPATIPSLVGRAHELATLTRILDEPTERNVAVVISAIAGTAGVGKTALAVHWAHRVRDRFPDGQLYVNLRGYDPGPPMTPGQALDGFLRALDVPVRKIPASMEEQAALYRSLLDGRRILVILDNANTAEQVRPLLPGSPDCLTVVTSRNRLSGLIARDGAHTVNLDPLTLAESIVLLRQIIGETRVDVELNAAATLAQQCAYLPLALRIAAERIASHPYSTLADLTEELANGRDRLDMLVAGDDDPTALRVVLSWSYHALPPETARVFRLLGLHVGPDISVAAIAALAGITAVRARQLLDHLTGVHLLEEIGRDRYRFHDLLRIYAAERAATEQTNHERDNAVHRLLSWYLHTADAAGRILTPQWRYVPLDPPEADLSPLAFTTYCQALQWCEAERVNLVAATRHAAECDQHIIAWKLAAVLWDFFRLRGHWADWITTHEIGLAATRHLRDRNGEAWIANNLGDGYQGLKRFEKAIDHLRQALVAWRELDDRWGEGWTLYNLGTVYRRMGRFDEALEHYHQALARGREMNKPWGEAWALHSLATTYRSLGRFDEAFDRYHQSLIVRREINDRWGEGWTLHRLAITYRSLGRFEEALDHYHQSLIVYREINDRWGEGRTLYNVGEVLSDTGQLAAARAFWHQALAIFEELGDPQAIEVRARLETLDNDDPDPSSLRQRTKCSHPPGPS